ncbi:hypothetical protein SAMN05444487_11099 [Marininema mesophilum]|uniref:Uncharacterized protein n=1 Tax=Marininema mesophilum TaxID=1048340 RepID=A0A1H2Z302_9BACL|nr:hypothetical protein SAMN05444487_11099 [Marininema mesophilum]
MPLVLLPSSLMDEKFGNNKKTSSAETEDAIESILSGLSSA